MLIVEICMIAKGDEEQKTLGIVLTAIEIIIWIYLEI
jgi:hypothetical protein